MRRMIFLCWLSLACPLVWAGPLDGMLERFPTDPVTGLAEIRGCEFVPASWADGDSFRVRLPGGGEVTVRIYGADCIELHISDDSDARRLRAQRRYFGIVGASVEESINKAKGFAEEAAAETARQLSKPFTLHTSFSDARGDGRFERIYGFVTTSGGRDLAEVLVEKGLARAFGVSRKTPSGAGKEEYMARLSDVELAAAKRGAGAWAGTDWSRLVEQRELLREEEADTRIATGRSGPPEGPVDLNRAARDELMRVPGIGEAMANRIIEGRPYQEVDELRTVSGIGPAVFERIREYFTVEKRQGRGDQIFLRPPR